MARLPLDGPRGDGVRDDQTDVDSDEHQHGQVRDHLSRPPLMDVAAVLNSGKRLRKENGQGREMQVQDERVGG